MGFSTTGARPFPQSAKDLSQSLSGWGGVFNKKIFEKGVKKWQRGRNPFQGGVGFSTSVWGQQWGALKLSQSLSGWGGVFNRHEKRYLGPPSRVAIPFRVGWGFQQSVPNKLLLGSNGSSRNPFQGGVGFSTSHSWAVEVQEGYEVAIPFRVGWGFQQGKNDQSTVGNQVAIPFRVGWGFQRH